MISTKGRYALRVMIDIADQKSDAFIPLKEIAERQEISQKYLEIIMRDLVRGGFLTGISGKGGGYKLRRDPAECSVGEILECMEGTMAPVACLEENADPCPRASFCKTLPLWKEYAQMTSNFFFGKTIADLM